MYLKKRFLKINITIVYATAIIQRRIDSVPLFNSRGTRRSPPMQSHAEPPRCQTGVLVAHVGARRLRVPPPATPGCPPRVPRRARGRRRSQPFAATWRAPPAAPRPRAALVWAGGVLSQPWNNGPARGPSLPCLGVPGSRGEGCTKVELVTDAKPRGLIRLWEQHRDRSGTNTPTMNLSLILCLHYLTSEGWALQAIFHPANPFSHACKSAHRGFHAHFSLRRQLEEYKFVSVLHASPVHNWS